MLHTLFVVVSSWIQSECLSCLRCVVHFWCINQNASCACLSTTYAPCNPLSVSRVLLTAAKALRSSLVVVGSHGRTVSQSITWDCRVVFRISMLLLALRMIAAHWHRHLHGHVRAWAHRHEVAKCLVLFFIVAWNLVHHRLLLLLRIIALHELLRHISGIRVAVALLLGLLLLLLLTLVRSVNLIGVVHLLNLRTTACHGLKLLDLENTSAVSRSYVFSGPFTVLLELFVDVQK